MKKLMMVLGAWCMVLGAAGANANKIAPDMVMIPGKGKLTFVNAAGVDDKHLERAASVMRNFLSIETEVCAGSWSVETAKKTVADKKAAAMVFVVKDEKLPMSLAALEDRWAMANVAGLSDKAAPRQILRMAALVIGCASSKYESSLMRPSFSPADLEKRGDNLTIDSLMAILPNLEAHGFKPFQVIDYQSALDEGIAPPPANDEQRKIKAEWEKEAAAAAKAAEAKKSKK